MVLTKISAGHNTTLRAFCLSGMILAAGACTQPEPIQPLQATGFDGKTLLVAPGGKSSIKFNQRVVWAVSGGTATQTAQDSLIYTAGTTVGMQRLVVRNERDLNDSLVIRIAVTPHAAVLKPLQSGGYVLAFRHAAADVSVDQIASTEPNWWKSCDVKWARQMNDQGKKDAAEIGLALKNLQIPVGRMISSEFCRCFTTAELMNTGLAVQQSKGLTYYVYDEPNRYANTQTVIDTQPADAQNSVLVIHSGFTGNTPNPAPLNALLWGDAAVFQLRPGQSARYVATVKVADWTALGK